MLKRPLLCAAAACAAAVLFLFRFFPDVIKPAFVFQDGESVLLTGSIAQIRSEKERTILVLADAEKAAAEDSSHQEGTHKVPGYILVPIEENLPDGQELHIGNRMEVRGTCKAFRKARNYGNFDEETWYSSQGIYGKIIPQKLRVISRDVSRLKDSLYHLQRQMTASITDAVADEETAGILAAICTGDRSLLTDESKALYQKSGIAHILAISGLHISLIGMTVFRLCRKKFRFPAAALVSSGCMFCFCIMTNASPSAVRATIMFLVQILAIGLGKTYDMISSVSLAAVLMLVYHPYLLFHAGFQFSFAAVLGAAVVYPALKESFLPQKKTDKGIFRWLSALFMSLSITLTTLPAAAATYYEVPFYAVLLNLLVIPLMSAVLGAGLASALLGMISILIGRFFAASGVYLVQFIRWMAKITEHLPGSTMITGCPALWRIAVYYALLLLGVGLLRGYRGIRGIKERTQPAVPSVSARRKGKNRSGQWLLISSVFLYITMSVMTLLLRVRSRELRISMLDADQGECIVLESPSGITCMIDCGSSSLDSVAKYRVEGALHYLGISQIDYLFVTHPDWDHISGVMEILDNKDDPAAFIETILTPPVLQNDHYREMKTKAAEKGVIWKDLNKGFSLEDGSIKVTCLYPDPQFSSEDSNAYSAVLDIRYGEFSMLAPGDLEEEGEAVLLADPGIVWPADGYSVLKAGHHGSSRSSSAVFLDKISPQAALISAGVHNRYGHPHAQTLERLEAAGAMIFCTAQNGEIILYAEKSGRMQIRTKL